MIINQGDKYTMKEIKEEITCETLSGDDKSLLINMICHRQTSMIVKKPTSYESDEYKNLEGLKVKIKNM